MCAKNKFTSHTEHDYTFTNPKSHAWFFHNEVVSSWYNLPIRVNLSKSTHFDNSLWKIHHFGKFFAKLTPYLKRKRKPSLSIFLFDNLCVIRYNSKNKVLNVPMSKLLGLSRKIHREDLTRLVTKTFDTIIEC